MALECTIQFDSQPWIVAIRDVLISGLSEADSFTRLVATHSLAQLTAVIEKTEGMEIIMILEVSSLFYLYV